MKTCKRNHSYSKDLKACPECCKATAKAWRESNSEQAKANNKAWKEANREQEKIANKAWRESNPAKVKAWAKANTAKCNAKTAKRRAARIKATPSWLTPEQLKSIELYYQAAQWVQDILQIPIHVDHIIPLQGENVSGLHVPWNLQLLPASENKSKGNKVL